MGVSRVFPRPPMETIFKDPYFVSGSGIGNSSGIGSGSDIAKLFKDPALVIPIFSFVFKDNRDTVLLREY